MSKGAVQELDNLVTEKYQEVNRLLVEIKTLEIVIHNEKVKW